MMSDATSLSASVEELYAHLEEWPLAASNYAALSTVQIRELGGGWSVMHNPGRVRSTGADLSKPRQQAGCFLCRSNRPQEQRSIMWDGGRYEILINPFPIFLRHLTIVRTAHVRQEFCGAPSEMFRLGSELEGYVVFYNGAQCGASAPEHRHYQAYSLAGDAMMGLDGCRRGMRKPILQNDRFCVTAYEGDCKLVYELDCADAESAEDAFCWLFANRRIDESLINVLYKDSTFYVIPRRCGRPHQFYEQDESLRLMVSPATVEMCGLIILPRKEDYDKICLSDVEDVMRQVAYLRDVDLIA